MAKSESLLGALDLLVLKVLSRRPGLHGYAIMSTIRVITDEVLRVEEGSLYPALQRLEKDGLVTSGWGKTDNNRRARYYRITQRGRRALDVEVANWHRFAAGLASVLRTT